MTSTLIIAATAKILVAFVYARGITLFKVTPTPIKVILSLFCDVGVVFIWELCTVQFMGRSIATPFGMDRFILFVGVLTIFVFFMILDHLVFNWRIWFPKPIGFDLKNLDPRRGSSKSFVYADSIPIKVKGDGWVRK